MLVILAACENHQFNFTWHAGWAICSLFVLVTQKITIIQNLDQGGLSELLVAAPGFQPMPPKTLVW